MFDHLSLKATSYSPPHCAVLLLDPDCTNVEAASLKEAA